MPDRPALRALAQRLGILPEYEEVGTRRLRVTTDDTYVALISAMGHDATSEGSAREALASLDRLERNRVLPPVGVIRDRQGAVPTLHARLPESITRPVAWDATWQTEKGVTRTLHGQSIPSPETASGGRDSSIVRIALPCVPEPGYHSLTVSLRGADKEWSGRQTLIVAPARCLLPDDLLEQPKAFGFCANLYTLKSETNWGVGDLGDLAQLGEWCGRIGGAFVGVNPLHAIRNVLPDISPYSPTSRLFRNPLYLEIPAVPELATCPEAKRLMNSADFRRKLAAIRLPANVEYERIMALKRRVLFPLFETFRRRRTSSPDARHAAFEQYRTAQARYLQEFATFQVLAEHFAREADLPCDGRAWPEEYRNPQSASVSRFADAHANEIEFECFLQFEVDRQMSMAAAASKRAGMSIGLYQDLAVASAPGGSDAWSEPSLFMTGVSIGAPPDDYSTAGQDWGMPPLHPRRLTDGGYEYWIRLTRNALAHSGALRIDHAMGLTRQFWIPSGATARDGAYVQYPAEDLAAILAIESHRHRALIVGEDLGTVPAGFSERLAGWGILSSRVLYFQRDEHGGFLPSSACTDRALITTTTHDHVPLAGFMEGRDIELRERLGLITDDNAVRPALKHRRDELRRLVERLVAEGALLPGEEPITFDRLCAAVHDFLAQTPAALVGVMIDDLGGETDPVNIPGVGVDMYPNWSRRMAISLECLVTSASVRRRLGALPDRLGPPNRASRGDG